MVQMIEANWLILIAALLIGIVVVYWVFVRGSKPAQRDRRPDVLDEGAAPAQRNQSLIDAPPAAHIDPPAVAGTMAGMGEAPTTYLFTKTRKLNKHNFDHLYWISSRMIKVNKYKVL